MVCVFFLLFLSIYYSIASKQLYSDNLDCISTNIHIFDRDRFESVKYPDIVNKKHVKSPQTAIICLLHVRITIYAGY